MRAKAHARERFAGVRFLLCKFMLSEPLLDAAGHNIFVLIEKVDQDFLVDDLHPGGIVVFAAHSKQVDLIAIRGQVPVIVAVERDAARLDLRVRFVASVSCHDHKFVGLVDSLLVLE